MEFIEVKDIPKIIRKRECKKTKDDIKLPQIHCKYEDCNYCINLKICPIWCNKY